MSDHNIPVFFKTLGKESRIRYYPDVLTFMGRESHYSDVETASYFKARNTMII